MFCFVAGQAISSSACSWHPGTEHDTIHTTGETLFICLRLCLCLSLLTEHDTKYTRGKTLFFVFFFAYTRTEHEKTSPFFISFSARSQGRIWRVPNFNVKYVDNFVKSTSGKMYWFSGKCWVIIIRISFFWQDLPTGSIGNPPDPNFLQELPTHQPESEAIWKERGVHFLKA